MGLSSNSSNIVIVHRTSAPIQAEIADTGIGLSISAFEWAAVNRRHGRRRCE